MRRLLFVVLVFLISLVPCGVIMLATDGQGPRHLLTILIGIVLMEIWGLGILQSGLADWLQRVILGTENLAGGDALPVFAVYIVILLLVFALGMLSIVLGSMGSVGFLVSGVMIAVATAWLVDTTSY